LFRLWQMGLSLLPEHAEYGSKPVYVARLEAGGH
jgi:hypothetical protein